MRRTKALLACSILPLFLFGCSDDDDDVVQEPTPEFANVRVVHAASDAPMVNVTANDAISQPCFHKNKCNLQVIKNM